MRLDNEQRNSQGTGSDEEHPPEPRACTKRLIHSRRGLPAVDVDSMQADIDELVSPYLTGTPPDDDASVPAAEVGQQGAR